MTNIDKLKAEYVAYFDEVPIQKYAAAHIERDEDTILRWRKEDRVFADRVEKSKAAWVRKKVMATKAEFALERLENAVFGPKASLALDIKQDIKTDPALSAEFTQFLKEKTGQ
jgi:hypothetical protein